MRSHQTTDTGALHRTDSGILQPVLNRSGKPRNGKQVTAGYRLLNKEGCRYAIRIKANAVLEREIEPLFALALAC